MIMKSRAGKNSRAWSDIEADHLPSAYGIFWHEFGTTFPARIESVSATKGVDEEDAASCLGVLGKTYSVLLLSRQRLS